MRNRQFRTGFTRTALALIVILLTLGALAACTEKDVRDVVDVVVSVLAEETSAAPDTEAVPPETEAAPPETTKPSAAPPPITTRPETTAQTTAPATTAAKTTAPATTAAKTTAPATTAGKTTAAKTTAPEEEKLDEKGVYTSKDDVALYLWTYHKLPSNFINKKEAGDLGWTGGGLDKFLKNGSIGGDNFGNYEKLLPTDKRYRECDIDTVGKSSRGAKRIVYATDFSAIYYTDDHYETFTKLYPKK